MLYDEFARDTELAAIRVLQDNYSTTIKWLEQAVLFLGYTPTDYIATYDALSSLKEKKETTIRKEYCTTFAKVCSNLK